MNYIFSKYVGVIKTGTKVLVEKEDPNFEEKALESCLLQEVKTAPLYSESGTNP